MPFLLLAALLAAPQPETDDYGGVVRRYLRCDDSAIAELLNLPAERWRARLLPDALLPAALVLHTDAALRTGDVPLATLHMAHARQIQQSLTYRPDQQRLRQRWHLAAAGFYFAARIIPQIQTIVGASRAVLPEAETTLLEGSFAELVASDRLAGGDREHLAHFSSATRLSNAVDVQRRVYRSNAEKAFQRVLTIDSQSNEARVRLAHVQIEAGRLDDAARNLAALDEGAPSDLRYWAALLSARLHLRRKDPVQAERAYRAALALEPESQTASIALAQLLQSTGRPDEASGLMERFFALAETRDRENGLDPWWEYFSGPFWRREHVIHEMRSLVRSCR